jgi:arylsulfatase A-like enzyme
MTIANHFYWGHDMKFHGENLFPEHFLSGLRMGEYARMNAEQQAVWDAHYGPENQAFIDSHAGRRLSDAEVTRWKHQRYLHDYLGSVQAVDDSVGRILDYLDHSGLADNTVVIYSSDQGFYLGEHGWYDKRWMFEESLKMPFLIRWPGVPARHRIARADPEHRLRANLPRGGGRARPAGSPRPQPGAPASGRPRPGRLARRHLLRLL